MVLKEKKPLQGTLLYSIKLGNQYLQGIEANEDYVHNACAPTMGRCHSYNEYKTIWGEEPKLFEKYTVCNYLQILFAEFVWKEKKLGKITVEPVLLKTGI